MNILVTHPIGNSNVRAILTALAKHNLLAGFDTSVSINNASILLNLLPQSVRQELLRRTFPISQNKIHSYPMREIARLILPRIGLGHFTRHEKGWACIDAVYNKMDKAVAKRLAGLHQIQNIDAVYAYEDGALETFAVAKKLGVKCIYDLPIAYWETGRKLMDEEARRLPDWAVTIGVGGGLLDSDNKLKQKTRELELADIIVVPSDFVKNSLPEWALNKQLIISPFGSPEYIKKSRVYIQQDTPRPLRVLFAGSMTQRKGLSDLFEAMKLLNNKAMELVVMGSLMAPMSFYRKQYANFIYEAGRPHDQVLELMQSCDVFCLPSIVEGRALVLQEAMSQGLPLIITSNTGGDDLIIEGQTGFLIPIRSPEAIAAKLEWFLNNRNKIAQMGKKAQEHAAKYTWENYGKTVVEALTSMLKSNL